MNTDLRELFETGLGPEPPLTPAHARVAAGRRALRRRRVVTGSFGAAAVAAVVFGLAQYSPNGTSSAPPPPMETVTPDTRTDEELRLTSAVPVDDSWLKDCGRGGQPPCEVYTNGASPVALQADGTLIRIADDVVIMRRADAWTVPDGRQGVAVELRTAAYPRPCWYVLTRSTSGKVTARTADPSQSSIDFANWVAGLRSGIDVHGSPPLQRDQVLVGD